MQLSCCTCSVIRKPTCSQTLQLVRTGACRETPVAVVEMDVQEEVLGTLKCSGSQALRARVTSVQSRCHSTTPRTGWCLYNRNLFYLPSIWRLAVEGSWQSQVLKDSAGARTITSLCPQAAKRGGELSGVPFILVRTRICTVLFGDSSHHALEGY